MLLAYLAVRFYYMFLQVILWTSLRYVYFSKHISMKILFRQMEITIEISKKKPPNQLEQAVST